jgi:bifunctional DNA-binding transcriptional regulator/antitoxin component of YhaV-PrlF toxin-antitoxin module
MAGRRKNTDDNVRSLTKVSGGRSYAITLPIAVVKEFGWKERQKIVLKIDAKRRTILLTDWKK